MISNRSTILRSIAFRKRQTPRNVPIFGRVLKSRLYTNHLGKLKSSRSKVKQPTIPFSCKMDIPLVYYEEIKDLCNHPEKLLIDVREPKEVMFGRIPQSINIPLSEICEVLAINVDDEQFQKNYRRRKPDIHTCIILYCRTGRRSIVAARALADLGYENVYSYFGSWLDFVKNECGE